MVPSYIWQEQFEKRLFYYLSHHLYNNNYLDQTRDDNKQ